MGQNSQRSLVLLSILLPTFCQVFPGPGAKSIYSYSGAYPVNYDHPEEKVSAYLSSPPVAPPEAPSNYRYENSNSDDSYSEAEKHPRRDSQFESDEDNGDNIENSNENNDGDGGDGSDGSDLEDYGDSAAPSSPPGDPPAQTKEPVENPLNFLNLAGTDFQPGRLVNIFFGLLILIFMIVTHGYILWIFGIAYLPGTRALQDWQPDHEMLSTLLDNVNKALDFWENEMKTNVS